MTYQYATTFTQARSQVLTRMGLDFAMKVAETDRGAKKARGDA